MVAQVDLHLPPPVLLLSLQRMCHDWLMQRRAQQDARTPHKMRRSASLAADSSLSLEEKKRKILRCLRRLETLGVLRPSQTHSQILHMIAKVTNAPTHHHHHVPSCDPAVQSRFLSVGPSRTSGSSGCVASAEGRSFRG